MQKVEVENINTLRFPGSILNLGVDKGTEDEFLNLLRLAEVKNDTDRIEFYKNPQVKVYRITPPSDFAV